MRILRRLCVLAAMLLWSAAALADDNKLTFNGYMNVESDYQPTTYGLGDKNFSIDADVLELLLNYKADDNFRVSGALDFEHGTDTEFNQGHLTTGWLFLEYAFSERLKLRAGKMLVPYGYFNEIHGAKNLFLSRDEARTTLKPQKITKNGFRYAPKWETGLEAFGRLPVNGKRSIDYLVMVGDGYQNETNPYEQDNNDKKSATVRVQYTPVDELTVGLSGYSDFLSKSSSGKTAWGRQKSIGSHVHYNGERWKALYEISQGRLRAPGGTTTAREVGQVAEVGFAASDHITPYVQLQTVTTHLSSTNEQARAYIVGFDYKISHFVFKLQDAEWTGSAANQKFNFPGRRYNEINIALFYAF